MTRAGRVGNDEGTLFFHGETIVGNTSQHFSDPDVKALLYICRFPHLGRFLQNGFSKLCDKNTATHVFVECIVFSALAVRSIALRFSSETEESLRSAEPSAAMLLPMRSRAVQITSFFARFIVFHVLHLIFLLHRSC